MNVGRLTALVLLLLLSRPACPDGVPVLQLWTPEVASVPYKVPPEAVDYLMVRLDAAAALLAAKEQRFALLLPEGRRLTVKRTGFERVGANALVWHGVVEGAQSGRASFSVVGEVVVGDVHLDAGPVYRLEHAGKGVGIVLKLDRSRFPPPGDPLPPRSGFKTLSGQPGESCPGDDPDQIDVMVVYTDEACAAAGNSPGTCTATGKAAMEARIAQAVSDTNVTFANSELPQRLSLVHVAPVTGYVEEGALATDLERLKKKDTEESDVFLGLPKLDEVHDWRDRHAADLVALVTKPQSLYGTNSLCGLSGQMTVNESWMQSQAFSVLPYDCVTLDDTFAHELGHPMGAHHDVASGVVGAVIQPYAHGYRASDGCWRTIMTGGVAHPGEACGRAPYWSNPEIPRPGTGGPMGAAASADNSRVLRETRGTVANFRQRTPCREDAWIRDTWQDTGGEPDPLQADMPMWKSPSIWVRTIQDPDGGWRHAHQHENPVSGAGAANWVYVKVENGGPAQTGSLKIYQAAASTGLAWESAWTPVGQVDAILPGHRSTILEVPWPDPPGPGHYCLLARWLSPSDPMTVPEGSAIEPNVRGNNNIAWRNLNIVELSTQTTQVASLRVQNTRKDGVQATIGFSFSRVAGPAPLTYARIEIQLDDALWATWKKGGMRAQGFKRDGDRLVMTNSAGARIDGLGLPPGREGRLSIRFSRLQSEGRTAGKFELDVTQWNSETLAGGVSYDVSASPSR